MFSIWKEGLCFITIFLPHFTFDAVCLSVGRLVYQQFSFIFFEEVAHTAIKFGIQNYNILSRSSSISGNDRTIFDRIMLLGLIENSNHMQFPFIFLKSLSKHADDKLSQHADDWIDIQHSQVWTCQSNLF